MRFKQFPFLSFIYILLWIASYHIVDHLVVEYGITQRTLYGIKTRIDPSRLWWRKWLVQPEIYTGGCGFESHPQRVLLAIKYATFRAVTNFLRICIYLLWQQSTMRFSNSHFFHLYILLCIASYHTVDHLVVEYGITQRALYGIKTRIDPSRLWWRKWLARPRYLREVVGSSPIHSELFLRLNMLRFTLSPISYAYAFIYCDSNPQRGLAIPIYFIYINYYELLRITLLITSW